MCYYYDPCKKKYDDHCKCRCHKKKEYDYGYDWCKKDDYYDDHNKCRKNCYKSRCKKKSSHCFDKFW